MLGAACGAGMGGVVDWADSHCDVGPWFVCGLGCSLCLGLQMGLAAVLGG